MSATSVLGQEIVSLKPNVTRPFTVALGATARFSAALKPGEVCDIRVSGDENAILEMNISTPSGASLVRSADPLQGFVFIAEESGDYAISILRPNENSDAVTSSLKTLSIKFADQLMLPARSKLKASRCLNGYKLQIRDQAGDEGMSYFTIEKAGKLKAVMRAEKEIGGGFYFSDGQNEFDDSPATRAATLMRTTADKTGDGTPDVAVEYYTGGAHCCFQITFFELGNTVRQLPTIDTDNDRLTAIARKPGGGLRFELAEQAFAYWAIAFAMSPMPPVMYEFNKQDELVPRFDLMRKPAPTMASLRRKANAAKAKINLNPYTSPEDNFNDFEDAFWGEMLDLIYTGHEDLAWKYFDMVWPAKKSGKEKFLADFKEQLSHSAYGEAKHLSGGGF